MKTTSKYAVLFLLLTLSQLSYAQLRIADHAEFANDTRGSAFLDASSSPAYQQSNSIGKGLIFPRVDLTAFEFSYSGQIGLPSNHSTWFDGMIVYNTASAGVAKEGATEGTLVPGFWYYDNKSENVLGGTWKQVITDGTDKLGLTTAGTGLVVSGTENEIVGIKDAGVGNRQLAPDAVTTDKIADGTIVTADLANNSVSSAKIIDGTIVTADLANNSVNSAKIIDGTIVTADLADNAVTSAKIANGTIVAADLNQMGATDGQALTWDGTKWVPTSTINTVTGTAPINVTAGSSPVVSLNDLGVTNAKLAPNAVTSDKIADGTIVTADLANNSVSSAKIIDGTIVTADLANNSVNSAKIIDGTIVTADLADNAVTSAKIANGTIVAADLNQMGATGGQALTWDGTKWAPTSTINAVTGTAPINVSAGATPVVSVTTGNLTVNASSASATAPVVVGLGTNRLVGGNATLQVNNTAPLWNANQLQGSNVANVVPSSNQVLKWNGSQWAPAADERGTTTVTGTAPINVTTGADPVVSVTTGNLTANASSATATAPLVVGTGTSRLVGGNTTLQVNNTAPLWNANQVQGRAIANVAPDNNQVLKWNGSQWAPADAPGVISVGGVAPISVTAGANPLVSVNTGNLTAGTSSAAATAPLVVGTGTNRLVGGGSALTVNNTAPLWNANQVQGRNIANTAPANGQVLKWNGSAWAPANDIDTDTNTDTNTTYSGSTSVTLSGTSFQRAALTGDAVAAANSNVTTVQRIQGRAWAPWNFLGVYYETWVGKRPGVADGTVINIGAANNTVYGPFTVARTGLYTCHSQWTFDKINCSRAASVWVGIAEASNVINPGAGFFAQVQTLGDCDVDVGVVADNYILQNIVTLLEKNKNYYLIFRGSNLRKTVFNNTVPAGGNPTILYWRSVLVFP